MLSLAPLRDLESVPQPLHDLALPVGIRQDSTGFKESVCRPAQLLLRSDDRPLRGGHSEDGRLELSSLSPFCLEACEPAQLLTRPPLRGFHDSHGALVNIDGAAQFDASRLLCHLA